MGEKSNQVLRELYTVKEFTTGRVYPTGSINVHNMASDCISVIEDLHNEIRILRDIVNKMKNVEDANTYLLHIPSVTLEFDEEKVAKYLHEKDILLSIDPVSVFADDMRKIREDNEARKLEKLRAELRGDIRE